MTKMWARLRRAGKWGCLSILVIGVIIVIAGVVEGLQSGSSPTIAPTPTNPTTVTPPRPVSRNPSSAAIREVQSAATVTSYIEPIVNVDIDLGQRDRNGDLVRRAGEEAGKFGASLSSARPPVAGRVSTINFTVLGRPGSDAIVGRKILRFSIGKASLDRLTKAAASSQQILAAATDVGWWTPTNDDVMRDYCQGTSAGICASVD